MQRIHLIGSSGAGKTTLGREIAARLGLPFTDLDDLYWEPGWHEVGHAELARRLQPRVQAPAWVIAGNYFATSQALVWPRATDIVVLDLPLPLLLRRATWRTLSRCVRGTPCCNGNRESWTRVLRHDAVVPYLLRTWRKRHARFQHLDAEPALAHAQVHRLSTPAGVAAWLAALPAGR